MLSKKKTRLVEVPTIAIVETVAQSYGNHIKYGFDDSVFKHVHLT